MTERVRGEDRAATCTDAAGNCCPTDNLASLQHISEAFAATLLVLKRTYELRASLLNSILNQVARFSLPAVNA